MPNIFLVDCSHRYHSLSGFIMTPNYPQNYDASSHCEFLITMDSGNLIDLTIMDFETEYHPNCYLDTIKIYDGEIASEDKLLLRHCGEQMPNQTTFKSSDNKMLITFETDGSIQKRGFKANYSIVSFRIV